MKRLVLVALLVSAWFGMLDQLDNPGILDEGIMQPDREGMKSSDPGDGGMGSWK